MLPQIPEGISKKVHKIGSIITTFRLSHFYQLPFLLAYYPATIPEFIQFFK